MYALSEHGVNIWNSLPDNINSRLTVKRVSFNNLSITLDFF